MDPNLSQLAHEAKDLLAPMLPYLLPAAAGAGKAALKRTGEKISDVTWKKAEALTRRLITLAFHITPVVPMDFCPEQQ